MVITDRRDSKSHILLLGQMIEAFPSDRWLVIEDNLSTNHSRETQVAMLAWPEVQVQFIPKYALWLNLIEPWWKQLKNLALKGRRFETADQLEAALWEALAYWNARCHPYRWKKLPHKQEEISVLWKAAQTLGGYGSALVSKTTPTWREDR